MSGDDRPRASNVGILGLEVYFPSTFVTQTALEQFDGVSEGKYTIGLGQDRMAFCADWEDINSMCLTVLSQLLSKYSLTSDSIGRLEVGTETIIDKSKSVKSVLMQILEGNTNVEGIDTTNACYGGTSALFNAVNWVESRSWDGRLAVVIAGDIASYAKGPARPTGGAGVVAILVGPDAPLVIEPHVRGSHMEHVYDFYKPDASEYPTVDGRLSISCYFKALDACYAQVRRRWEAKHDGQLTREKFAFWVFHAPFNRLVQKSYARLLWCDVRAGAIETPTELERFSTLTDEQSYSDRDLMSALLKLSKSSYAKHVGPSEFMGKNVGNMYCGSLYGGLASLISKTTDDELNEQTVAMFSYGSGLASTLFLVNVNTANASPDSQYSLANTRTTLDLLNRLSARHARTPEEFDAAMDVRESRHGTANWTPSETHRELAQPGTYVLGRVDEKYRRNYTRV